MKEKPFYERSEREHLIAAKQLNKLWIKANYVIYRYVDNGIDDADKCWVTYDCIGCDSMKDLQIIIDKIVENSRGIEFYEFGCYSLRKRLDDYNPFDYQSHEYDNETLRYFVNDKGKLIRNRLKTKIEYE